MSSPLDTANPVADAVLYEGYVLYPYRSSSGKNQTRSRWQFGVLVPPSYLDSDTGEHAAARTECLFEEKADPALRIRVRFLQMQTRTVQSGSKSTGFSTVEELQLEDRELLGWDEAVDRHTDLSVSLAELTAAGDDEVVFEVGAPAGVEYESVHDSTGECGRIVRETWPLSGRLRLSVTALPGPYGVQRLRAVLENSSPWDATGAEREDALRHSLIAAHMVFAVEGGDFISLLEPPEWAKGYVENCVNEHTWPVLVGEHGSTDVLLSSPIILYDYPVIAPESQGDYYDATEMDEMLTLRTLTLTEEEKRAARATDPKAASIIDRADHLPPELMERLHGVIRYLEPVKVEEPGTAEEILMNPDVPWWDPGADASVSPETDSVMIAGREVARGSKVMLQPGMRRADAQDMFLAGRTATVQAVLFDVDGDKHLAVAIDADPGADMQIAHGRFRYFSPDEVVPLDESESATDGASG